MGGTHAPTPEPEFNPTNFEALRLTKKPDKFHAPKSYLLLVAYISKSGESLGALIDQVRLFAARPCDLFFYWASSLSLFADRPGPLALLGCCFSLSSQAR